MYSHHGIYTGNGEVIHFSGGREFSPGNVGSLLDKFDSSGEKAKICSCTLKNFLDGGQLRLVTYNDHSVFKLPGTSHKVKSANQNVVVTLARYFINPHKWNDYNLYSNNCEHFAYYCKTNDKNIDHDQWSKFTGSKITGVKKQMKGPFVHHSFPYYRIMNFINRLAPVDSLYSLSPSLDVTTVLIE